MLYFMLSFMFEKFSLLLLYLHDNLTGYNLVASHILFLGTLLILPSFLAYWDDFSTTNALMCFLHA